MCADVAPKDFSTTAASNATVGGINIAEGSSAAQLNDAIRAVLAVIKTADWGSTGILADVIAESTSATGVTIDGLLIKDGALPGLTLGDTIPVGTMRPTFKSTADAGWKMMDGSTFGSAASAADDASDDNEDIFAFLWDNVSDTYAAVSSGRGANAAADWAANKTITMPDPTDRTFFGAGDTYAAGETFGAATVTLTTTELPAHTHTFAPLVTNTSASDSGNGNYVSGSDGSNQAINSNNTGSAGSGSAFSIVPPGIGVYWQIRY